MENAAIATAPQSAIAHLQEPGNLTTLMKVAKWYNPSMSDADLEARVMQEIGYFDYACMLNDNLATCDMRSIMMMVRWVIQNNLSIDTQAGLVYLKTRNVKQSNGGFIKVLEYEPSPEGILSMAYSTGEIIDHQRPVIHYSGEEKPRVVGVDFTFQLSTGRWETVSYAEGHFKKWRLASHENNARGASDGDIVKMNKANKSYTSFNGGIDPEFCTGKAIKHGLDKRGTNRIAPKANFQHRPAGQLQPQGWADNEIRRTTLNLAPPSQPAQSNILPEYAAFTNPAPGVPYVPSIYADPACDSDSPDWRAAYVGLTAAEPAPTPALETLVTVVQSPAPQQNIFDEKLNEAAQSAIPLDFSPDPIYAQLEACVTMADLGNLFTINKDKVLASDPLKAQFKAKEVAINEAVIAQRNATAAPAVAQPAASPKITANDL